MRNMHSVSLVYYKKCAVQKNDYLTLRKKPELSKLAVEWSVSL